MIGKNTSIVSLALSLVVVALVGNAANDAYRTMAKKAQDQVTAVDSLREWKRQYTALLPVEQRWAAKLAKMSEAKDLLTINSLLNKDSPKSNPDTLVVDKIERLVFNGQDLGAQTVCFSALGAPWALKEKSFSELIQGVQTFIRREDIQFGTITLKQEKGRAIAQAAPSCILLRDNDTIKGGA